MALIIISQGQALNLNGCDSNSNFVLQQPGTHRSHLDRAITSVISVSLKNSL